MNRRRPSVGRSDSQSPNSSRPHQSQNHLKLTKASSEHSQEVMGVDRSCAHAGKGLIKQQSHFLNGSYSSIKSLKWLGKKNDLRENFRVHFSLNRIMYVCACVCTCARVWWQWLFLLCSTLSHIQLTLTTDCGSQPDTCSWKQLHAGHPGQQSEPAMWRGKSPLFHQHQLFLSVASFRRSAYQRGFSITTGKILLSQDRYYLFDQRDGED